MANIERELELEKAHELKRIEEALKQKRNENLADFEKRLEKKKKSGGDDADGVDLGDMLADYGRLVKAVDEAMVKERGN